MELTFISTSGAVDPGLGMHNVGSFPSHGRQKGGMMSRVSTVDAWGFCVTLISGFFIYMEGFLVLFFLWSSEIRDTSIRTFLLTF